VRNGPSRSAKVVDFGANRKRVCDFLFVINSNLGPILPRFRDIADFLRRATPPLFHPNFRGVHLGLDCRCCGNVAPRSEDPKVIIRVTNFELVQPICPRCINVKDGRTDRQTYDSNIALALRASRGKNWTKRNAIASAGARERKPIMGVWERSTQRGSGAEPLVRGSGGEAP